MIINSLLDTDYYKYGMSFAVIETCKRMGIDIPYVQYKFKCRNDVDLIPLKSQIEKEIKLWQQLKFTPEDYKYISQTFPDRFCHYLSNMDLNDINISVYEKEKELHIDVEGKWFPSIFAEVPILSIVNELYFRSIKNKFNQTIAKDNLKQFLKEVPEFTDMGTRRRYSKKWHEYCLKEAIKSRKLIGTSNMMFARDLNIPCFGSMAHEWLMAFQVLSKDLRNFQRDALDHWLLTFRGKNSTALSDCIGIKSFMEDWDEFYTKNFNCIRHDSGDPFKFIDTVIKKIYGVNLLFSDGLNPKKCNEIKNYCRNEVCGIRPSFGIGTAFTNNVGLEPLQIVMKLNKVNGEPVCKISDSNGKIMCEDKNFVHKLKQTFGV